MNLTHKDLVGFAKSASLTADNQTAARAVSFYPEWRKNIGKELTQEDINAGRNRFVGDDGKLYKTTTPHIFQESWAPGIATAAVWVRIDIEHSGALEDPIPASKGMEYIYGLCYLEGEDIYKCQREGEKEGSKVTLAYLPSELVGQYFIKVE